MEVQTALGRDRVSGGIELVDRVAIVALEQNLGRTKLWKEWLLRNSRKFAIIGNAVFTSREDREMLSIALEIDSNIILGEKQILEALTPLLDDLHKASLL